MRGLYIHIPFCKHICNYCDFPKRIAINQEQINEYIDFIIEDMNKYTIYYKDVKTIYIGGGTPNLLSDYILEKLLIKVNELVKNPVEFTIEANPEFITESQVKLFSKYNINRVSLGVESFNDDDLIKLNRHHTKNEAIEAINLLKENGIKNINVDLIFAHPYDTIDKVKENLNIFKSLNIPHISYYSMILEDKTVFNHMINKGEISLLAEDTEAIMYETIIKELKQLGYHHYETSNFAIKGYESLHNSLYWSAQEYIGIGSGASGYLDHIRYTNDFNIKKYYQGVRTEEYISIEESKKEFMMLGFRLIDGIKKSDYFNRFGTEISTDFDLKKLFDDKLIEENSEFIKLTSKGVMLANEVFMEFV